MGVNLNTILKNLSKVYNIKLLAGEKGLCNELSWIYFTEDHRTVEFIRGEELIITTGMITAGDPNGPSGWLFGLIDKLISLDAVGLIINVGDYIPSVPVDVIEYCDEKSFPLFSIPWEVHLVDILRDVCNYIIENEQRERSISTALSVSIFSPENFHLYENNLRRNGFDPFESYATICFDIRSVAEPQKKLSHIIHSPFFPSKTKVSLIFEDSELVLVIYKATEETTKNVCSALIQSFRLHGNNLPVHMGIGPVVSDIRKLHESYQHAHACMDLAFRFNIPELYYDSLGFMKILLSTKDKDLLLGFCEETLHKLKEHDMAHNSDYMELLRIYLDENMNIQSTAQKTYTHRNTVNYRIQKIKELLNTEFTTPEERLDYQIALYIHNMYIEPTLK